MELTSKQRAQLRGLANGLEPIVHIGKEGIGAALVKQADDALSARELIKCRVLENAPYTAREACDALCAACGADGVQAIGNKFVLFKRNEKHPRIDIKVRK